MHHRHDTTPALDADIFTAHKSSDCLASGAILKFNYVGFEILNNNSCNSRIP